MNNEIEILAIGDKALEGFEFSESGRELSSKSLPLHNTLSEHTQIVWANTPQDSTLEGSNLTPAETPTTELWEFLEIKNV